MLCCSDFLKLILCVLPIFVKSFIYINLPNSIVHVPFMGTWEHPFRSWEQQHRSWDENPAHIEMFFKNNEEAYIIIIISPQVNRIVSHYIPMYFYSKFLKKRLEPSSIDENVLEKTEWKTFKYIFLPFKKTDYRLAPSWLFNLPPPLSEILQTPMCTGIPTKWTLA